MNSPAFYIEEEIRRSGPLSFARFMELALYAPDCGYYEQRQKPGRHGDFFTSVSVGPVFGALLAFRFAEWLEKMPPSPSGKWQVVEAGAHDGQLALDILQWWRERRLGLLAKVEYVLIEPSPIRRDWQKEKLGEFTNVRWRGEMEDRVWGIIFSNELLDAMPVHRLGWDAARRRWLEWRVGLNNTGLFWEKAETGADLAGYLPVVPPELAEVLPDGFLTEVSPAALRWWKRAAESLACGKLLTIDYGAEGGGWLQPERAGGTLRTYREHRVGGDVLASPGEQDITADVNFAAVRAVGEAAGLRTEFQARQAKFLGEIFFLSRTADVQLWGWTPKHVGQWQTLTHPGHLGHRFQALVQGR